MKSLNELKWSFSSLGCPELDLAGAIELSKRYGIERMELRVLEDRVDLPALFKEKYENPEKLAAYIAGQGMQVMALDTSLKLVGGTATDRNAFLEFVEWAEALGTPYLRVFDGGTFGSELSQEDLEQMLETISWWRELKRSNNWATDIMVETHDCLTSTKAVQQIQAKLEEPLPILWDTHHTWKKAGEAVAATWEALKDHVVHVHVKDSISIPSARHPMTYVLMGDGEFDLKGTLALFCESDFGGGVSLEWERQWHPYLPPMEEALKRGRELGWWG